MFKQKGGGGVKGFLNNVKKTALFLHDDFANNDVTSDDTSPALEIHNETSHNA